MRSARDTPGPLQNRFARWRSCGWPGNSPPRVCLLSTTTERASQAFTVWIWAVQLCLPALCSAFGHFSLMTVIIKRTYWKAVCIFLDCLLLKQRVMFCKLVDKGCRQGIRYLPSVMPALVPSSVTQLDFANISCVPGTKGHRMDRKVLCVLKKRPGWWERRTEADGCQIVILR